ncbi:Acg family FMN-binding oxidoreductase [Kitasatospora sp. NPDC048239]|uniref:Acg family FMN-binding oxidoreductase n=1 Tax=Kitasatospora sp. NPDC048239 TaxID=3364046 RepID=UPI0037221096
MTAPPLTADEFHLLAAAAGAAPSLHNSQPWLFRPTPDVRGLAVHLDPTRGVPTTDPDGRALHVSVGAAVLNLRIAAGRLGREPRVRLLPDQSQPYLAAEVDLSRLAPAPAPPGRDLYPAISLRHSSRQPFADRDVPEAVIGELLSAAEAEGVVLDVLEEAAVRRVLELTAEAERRTAADLARLSETRSWLRAEPAATDGIPFDVLGPLDHDARVPVRSFTGSPPGPAVHTERFEALPQVATLSTRTDLPVDWLKAGQAMERVWLLATAHGLRASVLHQAVEWPDTRWRLRDPSQGPGHVQLVLRLGYGPPGPATPRRPISEILTTPDGRAAGDER